MASPALSAHPARLSEVGGLPIHRALPVPGRRRIGAWCFLDRFGPLSLDPARSLDVGAHPHIGIQTVSYLMAGAMRHRDSLGCEAEIRPGGVNVMTAGRGIAHAEASPSKIGSSLHGVQLWVALPEAHRRAAPSFEHFSETPLVEFGGGTIRVFAGRLGDHASPSTHHTPLVGADVIVERRGRGDLALDEAFEHGFLVLEGDVTMDGVPLERDTLYAIPAGPASIDLRSSEGGRLLVLGGVPFDEPILMWWNFVARNTDEIRAAREAWATRSLGEIAGDAGPRIDAPPLGPGFERLRPS